LSGSLADADCTGKRLCELIRRGESQQALQAAIFPSRYGKAGLFRVLPGAVARKLHALQVRQAKSAWLQQFAELERDQTPGSVVRLLKHYFGDTAAADYFGYRAGQPRYLVTMALARLAEEDRLALDVGCGAGHLTRVLSGAQQSRSAVGIDCNFFLLWLANSRIAPEARFVCCDVENGLPFQDGLFDLSLMSNFFHFVYQKRFLLTELRRVATKRSLVVISSLRNKNVQAPSPNTALSPQGYQRLTEHEFTSVYMVAESALLSELVIGGKRALPTPATPADLTGEPLIDVILTADHVDVPATLSDALSSNATYRPNPLYHRQSTSNGTVRLEVRWPSRQYVAEQQEMTTFFPSTVTMNDDLLDGLRSGRNVDGDDLEAWVRTGVLVDLPSSY
jgi:SAM-dependent methyltransferase